VSPRARRPRAAATVGALLATVAVHAAQSADVNKKRRAPPDVPALVVGALRYEAPLAGGPFGLAQVGGVVVARRADSGDLVWARSVYTTPVDPHMERDKQDVFIASLTLAADGRHLAIVDERGRRFEIGLDGSGARTLP